MKQFFKYLGTFPKTWSDNSTKLFALLLSAMAGFILTGIVIPFCLIWDVISNGCIQTDLTELGVLILSCAGLIAGAGFNIKVPGIGSTKEKEGENE